MGRSLRACFKSVSQISLRSKENLASDILFFSLVYYPFPSSTASTLLRHPSSVDFLYALACCCCGAALDMVIVICVLCCRMSYVRHCYILYPSGSCYCVSFSNGFSFEDIFSSCCGNLVYLIPSQPAEATPKLHRKRSQTVGGVD